MKVSRERGNTPLRFLGAMFSALMLLVTGQAVAQSLTSPAACGLDSLTLLSPDSNGVRVRLAPETGRFGAIVQWAKVPSRLGTCAVVVDTGAIHMDVALTGIFADEIDREIGFSVVSGGQVGDPTRNRVMMRWANRFPGQSGRIEGEINVSNNGGLWCLNSGGTASAQINGGLPMTQSFTSILAFAQSPADPQRMWEHLGAQGLWTRAGGDWVRLNETALPNSVVITAIAASPTDPQRFAVGTASLGLFVTTNGGESFTQFTTALDAVSIATYNVTALTWGAEGRLWMSVRNLGVFVSEDDGESFVKRPDLLVPEIFGTPGSPLVSAMVNEIAVDPDDEDVIYFGLRDYGVYRSTDAGLTWGPLYGSWRRADDSEVLSAINVLTVARHPDDPQILLAGTSSLGLYRTVDGGGVWREVGADYLTGTTKPAIKGVLFDPATTGLAWAAPDGQPLLRSTDGGETWSTIAANPGNASTSRLALDASGNGDLWVATYDGGIYVPGTPLSLSQTILPITDPAYVNFDFGLSVAFWGEAVVDEGFRIKCQDFQGYAVWRSEGSDPQAQRAFELIGLYDKANPQSCLEGYCGDVNYILLPDCFEERRAACFDFSRGDTIEFFDDSIYNGFEYNYAVTTYDYGSTAGIDPASLVRDLLFSARYPGDPNSPFTAAGAIVPFRADVAAAPALDGTEIYVYPNPLRRGAGYPGVEGEQVVFTNLPPESRIVLWTLDGDVVAEIPRAGEAQSGGNIYWDTRNPDGELLASGVYIWKVQMPQRGDFYGKLVIIR